jgi:hypothetical protein
MTLILKMKAAYFSPKCWYPPERTHHNITRGEQCDISEEPTAYALMMETTCSFNMLVSNYKTT